MGSAGRERAGPSQGDMKGPGQNPLNPCLLPRPSRAESVWQRLVLNPRKKPLSQGVPREA